jgi:hypothetical protein
MAPRAHRNLGAPVASTAANEPSEARAPAWRDGCNILASMKIHASRSARRPTAHRVLLFVAATGLLHCAGGADGSSNAFGGDDDGGAGSSLAEAGASSGHDAAGSQDSGSLFGVDAATEACTAVGCACVVGTKVACWTGPPTQRGMGACHDGVQNCVQVGEQSEWGACTGEQLDCAEAGPDAPACTMSTLTWTVPYTGFTQTYSAPPKTTILSLESVSGIVCFDQNGNCAPCYAGVLGGNGTSYDWIGGDFDNDNSGACTFVFDVQVCP